MTSVPNDNEPCYVISVAAEMIRVHPQTLRRYEALGLIRPARISGRRLYSPSDIERLRKISRLTEELGVNLAGVEVILNLTSRLEQLQLEMERMRQEFEREIERLRRSLDS